MKTVSIPVMAKVRIGHIVEAQILQALDVDYIDESEYAYCSISLLKFPLKPTKMLRPGFLHLLIPLIT